VSERWYILPSRSTGTKPDQNGLLRNVDKQYCLSTFRSSAIVYQHFVVVRFDLVLSPLNGMAGYTFFLTRLPLLLHFSILLD